MKKVSIVIPVFNREKSIQECIESVQAQSLKDIEIICIDDGSTDLTKEVITRMRKIDSRIILVEQEHMGPGMARNTGILQAEGEYICFLDSDDYYYDKYSLEKLYNICVDKKTIVCGGEIYVEETDGRIVKERGYLNHVINEISVSEVECSFSSTHKIMGFTAFLYNRRWLIEKGIFFPSLFRMEDPVFLMKVLCDCGPYYVIPLKFYVIRKDYSEVSHIENHIEDIVKGCNLLLELAIKNTIPEIVPSLIEIINSYENAFVRKMNLELLMGLLTFNNMLLSNDLDIQDLPILNRVCKVIRNHYMDFYPTAMPESMKIWVKKMNNPINSISNWFCKEGIKECLVYGVGIRGNSLIGLLLAAEIKVVGTVDCRNNHYKNIKSFRIDDNWPDCDAVIVTPNNTTEMMKIATQHKCKRLITLSELMEEIH